MSIMNFSFVSGWMIKFKGSVPVSGEKSMKINYKVFFFIAGVAAILELVIFNARIFELVGCRSPSMEIFIPASEMTETYENHVDRVSFEVADEEILPSDLRTVRFIFTSPSNEIISGSIHTTELSFHQGHTREFEIIPEVEHSEYIFVYPRFPVKKLSVTLSNLTAQDIHIVFNTPVPFHFNVFRFILIFLFLSLLYILRPGSEI